jgi:hypothetical protein
VAAIEKLLETLATDADVEPVGNEALSFVQERKAVHQMKALADKSVEENKEPLLRQLRKSYIALLHTEDVTPQEYLDYHRIKGMMDEYETITLKLPEFAAIHKNWLAQAGYHK